MERAERNALLKRAAGRALGYLALLLFSIGTGYLMLLGLFLTTTLFVDIVIKHPIVGVLAVSMITYFVARKLYTGERF
jgi:hypothetical protein